MKYGLIRIAAECDVIDVSLDSAEIPLERIYALVTTVSLLKYKLFKYFLP